MTDSQAVDNNGGWLVGGSPLAGGLAPAETAQGEPDAMPKGKAGGMDGIWMGYGWDTQSTTTSPRGCCLLIGRVDGWIACGLTLVWCGLAGLGDSLLHLKDSWQELNPRQWSKLPPWESMPMCGALRI